MPRRSASNPGASIQLFPFLAVLICTMGSLVTLLFAFARHGQQQAMKAAEAKAAAQADPDVDAEREGLEWRVTQLQQSRNKTQDQLSRTRAELSHVEDHLRRLREQARRLKTATDELELKGQESSLSHEEAELELQRLRSAIERTERYLRDRDRKTAARPVTYSVVPYEGPNQTRRRPIYIECRQEVVIIQPEGIVLKDTDFLPPLGPGNPLAASIRAYDEYLSGLGFTGETTRPYPMLLVRPDGIEAFYAARQALTSWGTEFGYELVGEDWKLEFPQADARLAANLQQVLADARVRQEALIVAAPRQYKRSRTGLRASPNGHGFVAEGGYEGGSGGGSRSDDRYGDRYARRGSGFGTGGSTVGRHGTGVSDGGGQEGGGSESYESGSSSGGGTASDPGNTYSDVLSGGAGGNRNTAGNSGTGGNDLGSGGSRTGGLGDGTSPGGAEGQFGMAGGGTSSGSGNSAGTGKLANGGAADGANGSASSGLGGGGGSLGSAPQNSSNGNGNPRARGPYADGTASSGTSGRSGSQKSLGTLATPGEGYNTRGKSEKSVASKGSFEGNSGSSAGAPSGATAAGGASGASGANSGASSGSLSSDDLQQAQNSGAAMANMSQPPPRTTKSLAKSRGRDWGLPDGSANMVPVTRPVVIKCQSDKLTVVPEDKLSAPREINLGDRTEDSVDELVSEVWHHIKGWGLAGRGLYWRPTLVMEIAPGADARFTELQSLLSDSGLEVRERQKPASTADRVNSMRRK